MVFIFILDVISSLTLSLAVKCSSWALYKSANGLYYIYKKIRPDPMININDLIDDQDNYLVVLTEEEYNKLSNNQNDSKIDIIKRQ